MWNYALNLNINIAGPSITTAKKYKHQTINLLGITFKKINLQFLFQLFFSTSCDFLFLKHKVQHY